MHDNGNPRIWIYFQKRRFAGVTRTNVEFNALMLDTEFGKDCFGNARCGHGRVIKRETHRLLLLRIAVVFYALFYKQHHLLGRSRYEYLTENDKAYP